LTLGIQTEAIQSALGKPQRIPTEPSRKTASANILKATLVRLHREESAQDMLEYGLLGAVLALGAISGINNVADKVSNAFGKIDNRIDKATQSDGDHGHGGWGDRGGWGGWH
jgi:Flp pilus assembly pilin Flp